MDWNFDSEKMLFSLRADEHSADEIRAALAAHPEVRFVSVVGLDIGGHDTDEKIPVREFLKDIDGFLAHGVQTDGSSVVLPKIAALNNAKVDLIPDKDVNWYVDYNYKNPNPANGLPTGTLRIPAYLKHNDTFDVGSRVMLRDALSNFERDLIDLMRKNPYIFDHLPIGSADDIEKIVPTCATELEFWVKTPEESADREQLSTAETLKEQYWKRTVGPVRTALERTLILLDEYGFGVEMGHKEVGGVKAKMGHSGHYDHIMEQLEIDWKYSSPMQAADNENQIKYLVKDIFRLSGLEVTFQAKPMEGVAGSGEHTHFGLAAKLKDGRLVSLFAPKDMDAAFLSPIGFGALMGLLKNYEVINPFVSSSNDSFNRLKPGFEAPVCIVTSLGHGVDSPSRNRTVLAGLIRDKNEPLATRFELRSPNPKSNTYLIIAAVFMAMLDGIKAALENGKTEAELEASISKKHGVEDFYLETGREYRSEKDVFDEYSAAEREELFGVVPRTVWENICAFEKYPEKLEVFKRDGVMSDLVLESYKDAIVGQWATELHNRIIPKTRKLVHDCEKLHNEAECADYDLANWSEIEKLRSGLAQDHILEKSLLTRIAEALDAGDYDAASDMQLEMHAKVAELIDKYIVYKRNLI